MCREYQAPSTQLEYTILSLENGTQYWVRVVAVNANGRGGASNVLSDTPSTTPGAPTGLVLTAGNGVIRVRWDAPEGDGGSDITGYTVQWKSGDGEFDDTSSYDTDDAETLTYTIRGLTNGVSYDVRVLATNDNGSTESSSTSATPILVLVPTISSAGAVSATITQTSATVRVGITNVDGNSRTVYMRYSPDVSPREWSSINQRTTVAASTDFQLSDIKANTKYVVEASLGSSFQPGTFFEGSFLTAPDVPGSPTDVVVTPGDKELTVSWAAPESDGGAVVTSYRVQWKSGNEEFASARENRTNSDTLSSKITDLANDTEYVVRVIAVNSAGAGQPSDVASGTPLRTAEPAVSAISISEVRQNTATVSVAIANRDESEITNVFLRYRTKTPQGEWSSISTAEASTDSVTFELTGLQGNTEYEAQASLDSSFPEVDALTGTFNTEVTVPGQTSISQVTTGDGSLTVIWVVPETDGGSEITAYKVQWKSGDEDFGSARQGETNAQTFTFTISGLADGTEYDTRVIAVNAIGEGESSESFSATPGSSSSADMSTDISDVRVTRDEPTEAEVTVDLSVPESDTPTTVYLRYRTTIPEVGPWSETLTDEVTSGGGTNSGSALSQIATTAQISMSVTFTLSGLNEDAEYEIQVSLDESFPEDEVETASTVEPAPSPTPAITDVTAGDRELRIFWTPPADEISEITGWDLRYIRSDEDHTDDGNWTVLPNITASDSSGGTPPRPVPVDECRTDFGILTADISEATFWTSECPSSNNAGAFARFYTFTLQEDTDLSIDLTSDEDTYMFLLEGAGRDGAVVTENDDVNLANGDLDSRIARTLVAGTYTIEATTYNPSRTGEFVLAIVVNSTEDNLEPPPPPHPEPAPTDDCIAYLETLTEDIARDSEWTGDCASENNDGRFARYYAFTLDEESEVQIDLTSEHDTYLFLLEDAGREGAVLTENDDVDLDNSNFNSQILTTLDAGDYTIEATTYAIVRSGAFILTIDLTEAEPEVEAAGTLNSASADDASQVAADSLEYTLAGLTNGTEYDLQVRAVTADGARAWSESATGTPTLVDDCVTDLGTIIDRTVENGSWTGDCASTNRPGAYARFYAFTLEADAELQIDLTSEEDTYLFLLNGAGRDGSIEHENDDVDAAAGDFNSRIADTLVAGTYTIEATTYDAGAIGEFTLTIGVEPADEEEPSPPSRPDPDPEDGCMEDLENLTDGVSVDGDWTSDCASTNRPGAYARFYAFTLEADAELQIDLTSEEDTYLFLLNGAGRDGSIEHENDDVDAAAGDFNSRIVETFVAGTYTIEATTYDAGATGEFALSIAFR